MAQKTVTLKQSIKLTQWMELNHVEFIKCRNTCKEIANRCKTELGFEPSPSRVSDQAKAMGWSDWPVRGGVTEGRKYPRNNTRFICDVLQKLITTMESRNLFNTQEDLNFFRASRTELIKIRNNVAYKENKDGQ